MAITTARVSERMTYKELNRRERGENCFARYEAQEQKRAHPESRSDVQSLAGGQRKARSPRKGIRIAMRHVSDARILPKYIGINRLNQDHVSEAVRCIRLIGNVNCR